MRRKLIDLSGYMTDLYELIALVIKGYVKHLEKIKSPLFNSVDTSVGNLDISLWFEQLCSEITVYLKKQLEK